MNIFSIFSMELVVACFYGKNRPKYAGLKAGLIIGAYYLSVIVLSYITHNEYLILFGIFLLLAILLALGV